MTQIKQSLDSDNSSIRRSRFQRNDIASRIENCCRSLKSHSYLARFNRFGLARFIGNAEVTPARVEAMMMNTRMQLLKIPEVMNIKCGKRIDPELPWPFFIAIDFESMDKYAIFREDPVFVKFMEEVIKPNIEDSLDLDFEMDPGKDVRFS
ncbi:MAG: hypothetical protein DME65_12420 [Verrucomicrobia bacterium]|nr:MAG: hypothetical protein DME65_12420 [Verrucomicrobiota bacterium]